MTRLLYLRPFRDRVASIRHLKQLCRVTRRFGATLVLDSLERNAELGRIRGLVVLQTTDQEWVDHVVRAIAGAPAIIYHLVPKEAVLEGRLLDAIVDPRGVPAPPGSSELRHLGTGAGLLQELLLCRDHGDLDKVIVVSPDDYLLRLRRILDARGSRLSDQEAPLRLLNRVRWVIPYRLFGDFLFRLRLKRALRTLLLKASPAA